MAEPIFVQRRAAERPLVEDGFLRHRAVGLILVGAGVIAIGIVASDAVLVTGGMIGVTGGGVWWLWLFGKKLRGLPSP